jgi:hypothetical protein
MAKSIVTGEAMVRRGDEVTRDIETRGHGGLAKGVEFD